jgi:hypothetical protein
MESSGHFIAYHNSDERGPFYGSAGKKFARKGKEYSFVTAKMFREETLKGHHLWAFEGSSCGFITRITKWKRPARHRKAGRSHRTEVYFRLEADHKAIDVTDFPWFRKLLRQQQSFRNGFNRLTDRIIIRALEQLAGANNSAARTTPAAVDQRIAVLTTRRSPSAAAEMIRQLVPKRHWKDVLKAVAHSVEVAHKADPSKWGLRLNRQSIMLKVGFVEVMHLEPEWFHELVQKDRVPAQLRLSRGFHFSDEPYVHAPNCDTCDMDVSSVRHGYERLLSAHEDAISVAARSHRHTTTAKDHSPGLVVFLSQELGVLLPQPSYINAAENGFRFPEEVLPDEEFREGAVIQVIVNRYERDPAARERCIQRYGTSCFVCGVSFGERYGPEIDGLIHVHHLTPLASIGGQAPIDPVRDLRPVCPNCHAVIHSTRPARTIEQVQKALRKYAPRTSQITGARHRVITGSIEGKSVGTLNRLNK